MKRRSTITIATLLASTWLAGGCVPFLYDASCGPEFRVTSARADIRDSAGARIGSAELLLSERRADDEPRAVRMIVMGPAYANPGPLSKRVTGVRLLDGSTVRELAFRPGNDHEIVSIEPLAPDERELEALKAAVRAGKMVLELSTDLPRSPIIRVPLPLKHVGGWELANCS